jgi:glycosyltransferase involved in cell wall biosynthesis
MLREGHFKSDIYFYGNYEPKLSFIATVHNKEKYLKSFIYSIQNQNLKEFELIIVDDYSNDHSIEIIKNFAKTDKRIKLIINKKNMGSLYSRYNGAILSKAKYIIFVDSDDIILKEGISNSYHYINKNNLDMIQFNSVLEKNESRIIINRRCYIYSSIIYQPILSYIFYYNKNNGIENNSNLWDKLVKRRIVLNSLKYIGIKYLKEKIIIENDVPNSSGL